MDFFSADQFYVYRSLLSWNDIRDQSPFAQEDLWEASNDSILTSVLPEKIFNLNETALTNASKIIN